MSFHVVYVIEVAFVEIGGSEGGVSEYSSVVGCHDAWTGK
jgi:hypothetical protein